MAGSGTSCAPIAKALQPEDVGLPRRARRRTDGLRREEVAELSGKSTDYYARLERGSGLNPSEQMVDSIARGLRLTLAERDHLFALAGHRAPRHVPRSDHISPGLMRILDRLDDTPAQVMGSLGETLVQTDLARALLGEQTQFTGMARSAVYRWFSDPCARDIHPREDHPRHGRIYTAQLRRTATVHGPRSPAANLATQLRGCSAEFAAFWDDHEVGLAHTDAKRFAHPLVGDLDLHCQSLLDPDQEQALLVFTATPGTQSQQRLHLLAVLGTQHLEPTAATTR